MKIQIGICYALSMAVAAQHQDGVCYQDCELGNVTVDLGAITTCLEWPIEDGGLGGSANADVMIEVYNNAINAGIQLGSSETLLNGFLAAKSGATLQNSEGLFYCIRGNATNGIAPDAFYWVLNCNILEVGKSGDEYLCQDLTDEEVAMNGFVGFVVDSLLFLDDAKFYRYVFNETELKQTEIQPLEGGGFRCSDRPWFRTSLCTEPLALACPTALKGTTGFGAFLMYGDTNNTGVVVAQDVREWQMTPCLGGETESTKTESTETDSTKTESNSGGSRGQISATNIVGSMVGGVLFSVVLF